MDMATLVKRFVFLLTAALFLGSCAHVEKAWKGVERTGKRIWEIAWPLPEPGEKLDKHPQDVWTDENCSSKRLPYFRLDDNKISPSTIAPGKTINHRFIYTMCSKNPGGTIPGRLRHQIYFQSQVVNTDVVNDFQIKPGRWIVDSHLNVPAEASPGVYYLQVDFNGAGAHFKKGVRFVVK